MFQIHDKRLQELYFSINVKNLPYSVFIATLNDIIEEENKSKVLSCKVIEKTETDKKRISYQIENSEELNKQEEEIFTMSPQESKMWKLIGDEFKKDMADRLVNAYFNSNPPPSSTEG